MLESIKNSILSLVKTLDKPVFLKEFSGMETTIQELTTLQEIINDEQVRKQISNDINYIRHGEIGERNVAYELTNSFLPMYILHDVSIKHEDYKAQLDFVIITNTFICILETKKLNGDITITSDGDFIRHFKNAKGKVLKKEGMYSPISQNQRHVRILRDLLIKEKLIKRTPIYSLVVIANPKSIINYKYVKKEIRDQIIKYDQLTPYFKSLLKRDSSVDLSLKRMEEIGLLLLKHSEQSNNSFVEKYKQFVTVDCSDIEKDIIIVNHQDDKQDNSREKVELIKKALTEYRLDKSREEKVKAYFIFNNKQLEDLLDRRPLTEKDLLKCSGFGPVKVEKYGDDILKILNG